MVDTSKADRTLQEWFQAFFDKLHRVNNVHIVWFVLFNGVLISLSTTGYFGDESINPFSLVGGLYALNFFTMMLFAASKFNPTIKYLGKLFVAGIVGYSLFWQIASMTNSTPYFKPFVTETFGLFIYFASSLGAFIFAFSGHTEYVDPSTMGISTYELEKMREAMALMEQLPQDVINQYSQYS